MINIRKTEREEYCKACGYKRSPVWAIDMLLPYGFFLCPECLWDFTNVLNKIDENIIGICIH